MKFLRGDVPDLPDELGGEGEMPYGNYEKDAAERRAAEEEGAAGQAGSAEKGMGDRKGSFMPEEKYPMAREGSSKPKGTPRGNGNSKQQDASSSGGLGSATGGHVRKPNLFSPTRGAMEKQESRGLEKRLSSISLNEAKEKEAIREGRKEKEAVARARAFGESDDDDDDGYEEVEEFKEGKIAPAAKAAPAKGLPPGMKLPPGMGGGATKTKTKDARPFDTYPDEATVSSSCSELCKKALPTTLRVMQFCQQMTAPAERRDWYYKDDSGEVQVRSLNNIQYSIINIQCVARNMYTEK